MKNLFIILAIFGVAFASELGDMLGDAVNAFSDTLSSFGSNGAKEASGFDGMAGEADDASGSIPGGDAGKSQMSDFQTEAIEEAIGLIIEPLQKLGFVQGAAPDCNTKYITKIILELKQVIETGADPSNMKDKIPRLITQLNGMNRHWDQLRSVVQDPGLVNDALRTNLSNFNQMLPVIFGDVQPKRLI